MFVSQIPEMIILTGASFFKTGSVATKMLVYCRIKLERHKFFKAITREHIFCNYFLGGAVHDIVLDPETYMFFSDEAWFHLIGYSNVQNNSNCRSINPRENFEVALPDQKIQLLRAIIARQIRRSMLFNRLLIQSGTPVTISGSFLRSLG
jgi:hypothetical protein